ncbi:MAG: peptidylprolyl isomerase [Flavobacteriaceae bacterium]
MKYAYAFITLVLISLSSCKSSKYTELADGIYADIQTSRGDIIVRLEHEKTPVTVANFISLAEGTNPFVSDEYKEKKYYDGVIFHRVIQDFMIQGGDPTGSGSGNPGYRFKDEINDSLRHNKAGILSMANAGPKTNGCQFFITHKETPFLDGKHTVFGEVISGMDVVDTIAMVKTYQEPNRKDRPVVDVVMNTVEIVRKGKEAKKFDAVQILSDYFGEEERLIEAMKKVKNDFIAEITGQKNESEELPSGLKIYVISDGEGPMPKIGDSVLVNYAGWLSTGVLFDTSEEDVAEKFSNLQQISRVHRNGFTPIPMTYSPDAPLIPGFKEGLLRMKVGDKHRLFIPSHLGLGPQGGGPIPPNSELIFDIEIVEITK